MMKRRNLFVAALLLPPMLACQALPAAAAPRVYETRGTIKSFGPDRHYANIRHDAIPGYMEAMTMSFEAGAPGQLAPFREGQQVAFSFSDEDGRRVIRSIRLATEP